MPEERRAWSSRSNYRVILARRGRFYAWPRVVFVIDDYGGELVKLNGVSRK